MLHLIESSNQGVYSLMQIRSRLTVPHSYATDNRYTSRNRLLEFFIRLPMIKVMIMIQGLILPFDIFALPPDKPIWSLNYSLRLFDGDESQSPISCLFVCFSKSLFFNIRPSYA
jgi:hypothetical protein